MRGVEQYVNVETLIDCSIVLAKAEMLYSGSTVGVVRIIPDTVEMTVLKHV